MKWISDPSHSEILFKTKHLMITTVTGKIEKFEIDAESDDQTFSNARINLRADLKSLSTGNAQRDAHLMNSDFFDTEKFPEMTFTSTSFQNGKLNGMLTIKDISQPVELNVEFAGTGKDPWGKIKAGFSVDGKINRTLWNLNWNATLEAGGLLVSEEVRIQAEIQLTMEQ